jgi:hypothetical protein
MVWSACVWPADDATEGAVQAITSHKNDAYQHNSQLFTAAKYNTADRTSIQLLFMHELVFVVIFQYILAAPND